MELRIRKQPQVATILHNLIHKEVKVYVDDIIVKSKNRVEHIANLEKFLQRIRKYHLRLNPMKCTFGVTTSKMMGFMITQRGIEVDSSKIAAITAMPTPRNERKIILLPCLTKWMMRISEYDISYTVQKLVKGSVLADFLDDQLITVEDDDEEMIFPDDEIMTIQFEA
ncbi:uncharacterized protein K02A2.6-like [Impatiens glandulifera]|uniref:uncharacterized protein K02A2.6-like n=1 Tax=Impatiens glandulifera TaxID=253017 RepID=UPI001FB0AE7B|nr:uncharacterized protein K02A2.6-like [Impatiens glandulifera]XP_047326907.1 uncharacterized protein K02A2.6-like [Impatiens glandulifera]